MLDLQYLQRAYGNYVCRSDAGEVPSVYNGCHKAKMWFRDFKKQVFWSAPKANMYNGSDSMQIAK